MVALCYTINDDTKVKPPRMQIINGVAAVIIRETK